MQSVRRIILLFLATILTVGVVFAQSADRGSLQAEIEAKRREVARLNAEIQQTQAQIASLQGQGRNLQGAISELDSGIKQATLNIRASEANIERLLLEIESLGYEIGEVGEEIDQKQAMVGDLLRTIQRKEKTGFLESILGSRTLAEGLLEINALKALQDNLSTEVESLAEMREFLGSSLEASSYHKRDLEVEVKNLESRKVILDEQKGQKEVLLTQTRSQEGEYQELLTTQQQQQRALLEEISDIESKLSKGFDRSTVPSRQPGFLIWPVTNLGQNAGVLTQHYGETAYSTRFYKGRPHNGTDIGAPIGTEVRASADGTVAHVDYNGLYYQYGRYIMIDHGNGLSTLYAHLSQASVNAGQRVAKGEVIGYVGNTGFATGPHLHFGLYATPAGGWQYSTNRDQGGLFSIPPATGLVPIGVTLNPEQYL